MEKINKIFGISLGIIAALLIGGFVVLYSSGGCAGLRRSIADIKSDVAGGMQRTINIYTANGDLLATYQGKIDIDSNDGGYVKCDACELGVAFEILDGAPAADVRENVYGKWYQGDQEKLMGVVRCSKCHNKHYGRHNFCPNCGTVMQKNGNDNRKETP